MLGFPRPSEYSNKSLEYSFPFTIAMSLSRHSSHIFVTLLCSMHVATSFATNHGSEHHITTRALNSGFSNSLIALDALGSSCEWDETMLSNIVFCIIKLLMLCRLFLSSKTALDDHWRFGCGVRIAFSFSLCNRTRTENQAKK